MNDASDGGFFRPPAMVGPGASGYEVGATAAAAQAKALAEARYIMALRNPRNMDQARQDLMRECRRPAFARNKSTYYRKPVGAGVEGLGIRFVETAMRCLRNIDIGAALTFEDDMKEVFRVTVVDLETNVPYFTDVKVSKTVERSKPNDDGSYLAVRRNTQGRPVYTVAATDDDLLNKRNALISKAIRTLGMRHIPGDMQDEGEAIIKQVRLDEAAKNPEAERHQLADAFVSIGVRADALTEYLGHSLGETTPAELTELRGIYGAIKDGESSWQSFMEDRRAERAKAAQGAAKPEGGGESAGGAEKAASGPATATGKLRERIKKATPAPAPAKGVDEGGTDMAETPEQLRAAIMAAKDEDAANLVLDRARHLGREDYDGLVALVDSRFDQDQQQGDPQ